MIRHLILFGVALLLTSSWASAAEDRDAKVHKDRDEVLATGGWIYNDLAKGITEAAQTRKPMLVVFRCIP